MLDIDALKAAADALPKTQLIDLRNHLPEVWGNAGMPRIVVADETLMGTGSLKDRLAHALLIDADRRGVNLRNGLVMASSGNSAVSVAWAANPHELPFVALLPDTTSLNKQRLIQAYGGTVKHYTSHASLAKMIDDYTRAGCHDLDQFLCATAAFERSGVRTLADELFPALAELPDGPFDATWFAMGAGTGGTLSHVGEHMHRYGIVGGTCLADPVGSVLARAVDPDNVAATAFEPSLIEGIGRPSVPRALRLDRIHTAIQVTDEQSIAGMVRLSALLGRRVGGSTGTAYWAAATLASSRLLRMRQSPGVVFPLADDGNRYAHTLYDPEWRAEQGLDLKPSLYALQEFEETGRLPEPAA